MLQAYVRFASSEAAAAGAASSALKQALGSEAIAARVLAGVMPAECDARKSQCCR